jgi:O-antigen ligase
MTTYALLRSRGSRSAPPPQAPPSAPAPPQPKDRARAASLGPAPRYAFWMLVIFLVLEYARPPVVVQLKLQMLFTLLLPLAFLRASERPWSQILTFQLLFFAWCVKGIPIATNWFAAYFTARTLFGNIAIAMGLLWVCSSLPDLRRVLWVYLGVMVYQAIWSFSSGGKGTGGFLGDENDLALACCTAFPLAFFGLERLQGLARWLCGAALVLLLAGVVGSLSRGGFLGLVCCGLYCWIFSRHKLRAAILVAVAVVAVPIFAPPNYVAEIRSIGDTDSGTAKGRRFLWRSAFNMWKANPILGVGGGNTAYLVGLYQPTDFEEREYLERDWSGTVIHSMYFQLLPEHGVVGVVLVGLMVWTQFSLNARLLRLVRGATRAPPRVRSDAELYAHALNGGLIGLLAAGAFLSVAYYPYLWYFPALAAALDLAIRGELPEDAPRGPIPKPAAS